MHRLGILLKSYGQDFHYAERMVSSFQKYNRDRLPLFLVVPDDDQDLFKPIVRQNTTLIPESDFAEHFVTEPAWGLRPGYINQEIVKLAFWETGLVRNYFCADSELIFIRDFGFDDFMFDAATPYTVLVEDNDLKAEPRYYRDHWQGREQHLRTIQELIGLDDRRLLTCHGHQVLSRDVLLSLKTDFMEPRGWDYRDLLSASPYEFSWYNFWLQKSRAIPIEVREPLVKTFHHEGHELESALRGIGVRDLARAYIGYVINSNYANVLVQDGSLGSTSNLLAAYVSPRELAQALRSQLRTAIARRLGRPDRSPSG